MDQNLNPEPEAKPVCASCSSPDVLEGYPVKLCADCRNKFIRYPIPLWVKLFGAGIGVVMIISIVWLPDNFGAAVALSRAAKAEKSRNYFTEQTELEKARKNVPNSLEVSAHLAIASFYNGDMATMSKALDNLGGKNIDDTALVNRVNAVLESFKSYYPSAAFDTAFSKYKNTTIPDSALRRYIRQNPTDTYVRYSLALFYVGQEKYAIADTILSHVLAVEPGFIPAMEVKGMVKREVDQLDSSMYYCNEVLGINHQSLYALSSKARTILKSGQHAEGLKVAEEVADLDKDDHYNLATLAIAYHLNKDFSKRDALVRRANKDTTLATFMNYAKDVISGKVVYK